MSLADQISPATPAAAVVMRIGVVQATPAPTADLVSVLIFEDTDPIRVTYLAPYVPVAGDVVEVFLLGGSAAAGIVAGGRAAQSGNMVVNPNFYRAPALEFPPVNSPPYHWSRYVASGSAAVVCQVPYQPTQRLMMGVQATSGINSGDTYAYSSAIPVNAGSSYNARSMGVAVTNVSTALTVQSRVAFFSDAGIEYPSFIAETQFGTDAVGASSTTNIFHAGSVTAPAGTTHARMILRQSNVGSAGGSGSVMYWSELALLRS